MAHQGLGYSIVKSPGEWKFRVGTVRCSYEIALKRFALDGLGLGFLKERFGADA